jgi:hypothetical protein
MSRAPLASAYRHAETSDPLGKRPTQRLILPHVTTRATYPSRPAAMVIEPEMQGLENKRRPTSICGAGRLSGALDRPSSAASRSARLCLRINRARPICLIRPLAPQHGPNSASKSDLQPGIGALYMGRISSPMVCSCDPGDSPPSGPSGCRPRLHV